MEMIKGQRQVMQRLREEIEHLKKQQDKKIETNYRNESFETKTSSAVDSIFNATPFRNVKRKMDEKWTEVSPKKHRDF